jgi:hypothetical protein
VVELIVGGVGEVAGDMMEGLGDVVIHEEYEGGGDGVCCCCCLIAVSGLSKDVVGKG